MQTKIHNLRQYSPAEIEAFRARMEAERRRQEEYREINGGIRVATWTVVAFLAFVTIAGALMANWWLASDRLVGLG